MTDLRIRPAEADGSPPRPDGTSSPEPGHAFRPASRRRTRIAAGVALAAAAIAGNLLVYSSLDDKESVVQVVRDVPAGEQIAPDMLRVVDAKLDDTIAVVPAAQIDSIVGRYAKVRLVAGALVTAPSLQDGPLISPGTSIVAIQLAEGAIPIGLRERVPVEIIIPADPNDAAAQLRTVSARVVALPLAPTSAIGTMSVSVEVLSADAATVAAAEHVRLVLTEPLPDPAQTDG